MRRWGEPNEVPPLGVELTWELDDWSRHDWHLRMNQKDFASLVAIGPLDSKFQGHFDEKWITMERSSNGLSAHLTYSGSEEVIGQIDTWSDSWTVRLKDGEVFFIKGMPKNEGIWFMSDKEILLAITHSKVRTVFRIPPTFKLVLEDEAIDPRLVAILSLYYALIKGGGCI